MKKNHRRGGKTREYPDYKQTQNDSPAIEYPERVLSRGHVNNEKPWQYIHKGGKSWGQTSEFADTRVTASAEYDASNMRRAVAGAKKFVRSRFRFAEKQALNKLRRDPPDE